MLIDMRDLPVNRVSGAAPIMMSVVALLAVAKAYVNYVQHGPPLDEDGPWHIFVIAMFAQLPITVDPHKRVLSDQWSRTDGAGYDLSVYGPNGFFRRVAGGLTRTSANVEVKVLPEIAGEVILLVIENVAPVRTTVTIANQYDLREEHFPLAPGGRVSVPVLLATSFRWYDVVITASTDPSFVRHYAGHMENGFDSVSDPHIGNNA